MRASPPEIKDLISIGLFNASDYWYLGSPYTKYSKGTEAAFLDIIKVAKWFMRQKINILSPIIYTHHLQIDAPIDFWLRFYSPFMYHAKGLLVAMFSGWEESVGVSCEINHFRKLKKPILYVLAEPILSLQNNNSHDISITDIIKWETPQIV